LEGKNFLLANRMKTLKIITVVVIILGVIIYSSSDYIIEKHLTSELSKLINKDSLNYYDLSLSDLDLNILNGSITIANVKITPSKYALDSIKSSSNNVRVLMNFSCEKIKMKNFEIRHFLKTQELIIDKFIINNPSLTYLYNRQKSANKSTLVLHNIFSDSFKKAVLNHFIIDNATIEVRNIEKNNALIKVSSFDFHLTKAVMDATTIKRFSPFDYKNIEFSAEQLNLNLHEDFLMSTDNLQFNAEKNTTAINNFKLTPKYTQGNYSKKYNTQKQWVAITLDTFKISNIHFEKLIQHGIFDVGKISLDHANIGLYKDKSKPEPPFKKKLLPASALNQIQIDLSIDTIQVKNSKIVINEKSNLSGQVSYLSFDFLNALVIGFSNNKNQLLVNRFLTVDAKTKVMNSADVNFKAKFDLLSPTDNHTINVKVGSTDIKVFNKVLEPSMLVIAKSGKIVALDYAYTADDKSALGTIDFEYENVKIDVLDKDEQTKKQGFMSLAANTIIKSNNKKENTKTYTQGIIKVERVQNKNIFPYLWHTVQSGIIYVMAPTFSEIKKEEKKANKKGWFKKK
jgi:hypothetical protein